MCLRVAKQESSNVPCPGWKRRRRLFGNAGGEVMLESMDWSLGKEAVDVFGVTLESENVHNFINSRNGSAVMPEQLLEQTEH